MVSQSLVDQLVEQGVLATAGSEVSLPDEFSETIDGKVRWIGQRGTEELRKETVTKPLGRQLIEQGEFNQDLLGIYLAIDEVAEELTYNEEVQAVTLVDQMYNEVPRSDGAPEVFLPVRGDQLSYLLRLYERSIVYVWLDDCDPCETVRSDLDDVLPAPPDDIALFAVYGPDYAKLLEREYGVLGGPVLLFFVEDEVDTRLIGSHVRDAIENEIENLRRLG